MCLLLAARTRLFLLHSSENGPRGRLLAERAHLGLEILLRIATLRAGR